MRTNEQIRTILREQVYDLARAANFLGIRTDSLASIAKRGRIPFVNVGRKMLFLRADIEAYDIRRKRRRNLKYAEGQDPYPRAIRRLAARWEWKPVPDTNFANTHLDPTWPCPMITSLGKRCTRGWMHKGIHSTKTPPK